MRIFFQSLVWAPAGATATSATATMAQNSVTTDFMARSPFFLPERWCARTDVTRMTFHDYSYKAICDIAIFDAPGAAHDQDIHRHSRDRDEHLLVAADRAAAFQGDLPLPPARLRRQGAAVRRPARGLAAHGRGKGLRSEEHTSELQS